MVLVEDIQTALHKIPWFNSLTPEHFQKTAELAHLRHAKAGETFFRFQWLHPSISANVWC